MGKYTPLADPRVDEGVERQLAFAVQAIRGIHPAAQAVVLIGGFGRGEGSAVVEGGCARALNDYDLLVISPDETGREPLRRLSRELAGALGMDFVDIGLWRPDVLDTLSPTIFNYDLKNGAQVLFGDPALLDRIPGFTAEQLPLWEGVQLLLNRMAGLLGGFRLQGSPPTAVVRAPQYFRNQVVKALLACGDALIVQGEEYTHRYAERCEIVRRWAGQGRLDWLGSEAVTRITEAYEEKLVPNSAAWKDDVALFIEFLPTLERVFLRCLSRYLGQTVVCIAAAAGMYLNHHRVGRLARVLSVARPTVGVPARHAVYACLPLLLFSIPLLEPSRPRLTGRLQNLLRWVDRSGMQPDATAGNGWEHARQMCVQLWERHCHG